MTDDSMQYSRKDRDELTPSKHAEEQSSKFTKIWADISHWGIAELVMRFGTHLLTIALIVIAVIIMRGFNSAVEIDRQADLKATAEAIAEPIMEAALDDIGGFGGSILPGGLPIFPAQSQISINGIPRLAQLETTIPTRARVDVTTYEVESGDNIFSIAEKFGLRAESILWGNSNALGDNLRIITPGLVLNILPVDGVYHRWSAGENINSVAKFYGVDPQTIIDWPGNELDSYEVDIDNVQIPDGAWVIVPGGSKAIVNWGPPAITRQNPAVAAYYGPGSCGSISEGAIGTNTFVWPTVNTTISGYYYDPVLHPAIDIGGPAGNSVFATDGGVVVYAGWSDYGFGFLVVVDHGTGWQSAYAHLQSFNVFCGQSVAQGDVIAAVGSTGNSSGAHVHFELTSTLYGKVNPLEWVFP